VRPIRAVLVTAVALAAVADVPQVNIRAQETAAPSANSCMAAGGVFTPPSEPRPGRGAFAPPTPALPEHCEVKGKLAEVQLYH